MNIGSAFYPHFLYFLMKGRYKIMSNNVYDTLKLISLIFVPVITFLTAFINIWHIPYGDELIATMAAADALLGGIVVIAKVVYDKKQNVVEVNVDTNNKEVQSEIEAINEEEGADA